MDSLTHGTAGLLLAYALTLIGVLATLLRRRATIPTLLLSPLVALPALVVGAIAASILSGAFKAASAALTVPANAALLLAVGAGSGLWLNRKRQADDVHKRGAVVEQGTRIRGRAAKTGITLAGLDIPPLDEPKHFKLMGTTGSGKSTAIRELLSGALARGDRALIADPDGGYLARFYDAARGDVILNPFDDRTARWDLFGEIEQPYDVEQVARSLIADGPDPSGREWRAYARTFLSAVLEYLKLEGPQDIEALWRLVAVADTEELRPLLAGTPAQPFLAEGAGKMFQSIRSTASPALAALQHLRSGPDEGFGLRRWVREGKGVLFLPYKAGQIAALRDLIATWMRLAIFETMNQPEGDARLWFVIDELDALGQIDGLKDALARLRKFGGRCVLGFQSIPRISDNPYIICGRLRGQYLRSLGEPLRRALKRAGLVDLRIHDLRRTVGSWLAQDGRSLHLIGDVLNHRDPKTTAGYAYFQTQQRRDALSDHGNRVLALTPAHLRKPAAPAEISATTLLPAAETMPISATPNSAARYRHYFRRQELYNLVWTSPVSEIAAHLGVSDVALAKLCRRADIPLPGRGYWQRSEAGQPIGPTPLAQAPKGLPELLRIRGSKPANESMATASVVLESIVYCYRRNAAASSYKSQQTMSGKVPFKLPLGSPCNQSHHRSTVFLAAAPGPACQCSLVRACNELGGFCLRVSGSSDSRSAVLA